MVVGECLGVGGELTGEPGKRFLPGCLGELALGIGLAANNSLAVFSALFGRRGSFERTPKSGAVGAGPISIPAEYRVGFDRTMGIEIFLALYALLAIIGAVWLGLFFTIPFLLTFAF